MKRIVAALLAVFMIVALLPAVAVAEAKTPVTFTVSTEAKNAKKDEIVEFTVTMGAVTELPMAGMYFELEIPQGLTYVPGSGKAASGLKEKFGAYETSFTDSGSKLVFISVGGGEYIGSDEITIMTFQCKVDGTVDKKNVEVTLKSDKSCPIDMIGPVQADESIETIPTEVTGAKLFLGDCLLGDANGDGDITLRDAMRITQYCNGWDVEINLSASDVNGDGDVTLRDAMRITQYCNGWDVTLG